MKLPDFPHSNQPPSLVSQQASFGQSGPGHTHLPLGVAAERVTTSSHLNHPQSRKSQQVSPGKGDVSQQPRGGPGCVTTRRAFLRRFGFRRPRLRGLAIARETESCVRASMGATVSRRKRAPQL